MLMLNLSDTGSISSLKQNLEDFYVFLFFVIESSVFQIHCIENLFLCCVLEFHLFSSLAFFLSVNVDFVAQSLASGTVGDREKQILSSLIIIIIALLEKIKQLQWKT